MCRRVRPTLPHTNAISDALPLAKPLVPKAMRGRIALPKHFVQNHEDASAPSWNALSFAPALAATNACITTRRAWRAPLHVGLEA